MTASELRQVAEYYLFFGCLFLSAIKQGDGDGSVLGLCYKNAHWLKRLCSYCLDVNRAMKLNTA